MIGHGGHNSDGDKGASTLSTISVTSTGGNVFVRGGTTQTAFALIGDGGTNSSGSMDGMITVNASGKVEVDSGNATRAYAQIGHGGDAAVGDKGSIFGSAINVTGSSVSVGDGTGGLFAYSLIGAGGLDADSGSGKSGVAGNGDVMVTSTSGDITLTGGNGARRLRADRPRRQRRRRQA